MRAPDSTDYLVPNNPSSTYSISSEKTELLSPDTCSTVTTDDAKFCELMEDVRSSSAGLPPSGQRPIRRPEVWKETSLTTGTSSPATSDNLTHVTSSSSTLQPSTSASAVTNSTGTKDSGNFSEMNNTNQEEQPLDPSKLLTSQKPMRYVNV